MFDEDSQTNQSTDNQQHNTQDNGGSMVPPVGLGVNPSAQQHVQPAQDTDTPQQDDSSPAHQPEPEEAFEPADPTPSASSNAPASGNGGLDDIKSQALSQLSPLVHALDQAPEDKYKTLMMMIQASDNQELIPEAYKAAQKIEDEKVKAEALLNIVNEINYFTQKG